jgi:DNA-directed RNA polymerase subunit beta
MSRQSYFRKSYTPVRQSFGSIRQVAKIPNLIQVQKTSYGNLLQVDVLPSERSRQGLQDVFLSVFPIEDPAGRATLEFVNYYFDEPKFDVDESKLRDINYSCALRATLRLIVWDVDPVTSLREIRGIKEQDVYMCDVPMMTENATFVINGTERAIVSQVHRSPGVFFDHDRGKNHIAGKFLYSARVIPYRGSWLDFEFDGKDILYVRIDRRRKLPVTTLLQAIGMSSQEIYSTFFEHVVCHWDDGVWVTTFNPDHYRGLRLTHDLVDAKTGKVVLPSGTKINQRMIKKLTEDQLSSVRVPSELLCQRYLAQDVVDLRTGEVLYLAGQAITSDVLDDLEKKKIYVISILRVDQNSDYYLRHTMEADRNQNTEDALGDIYRVMRPGEPVQIDAARALFYGLFFDPDRYDLSVVGRVKMNARLDLSVSEDTRVLTREDIIEIVRLLIQLKDGIGEIDDIDHLGNRRVRSVGELVENQFRLGLVRMERAIIERMSSVDVDTIMPHDLVNSKLLSSVLREFFGTSQLSQFMDQTNPLSEITHKRRLSALGPGGLSRDRASFEVRDVHPTHYGRICPVETPEGQNIGLINSMATFACVNRHGFIESPYRRVKDGVVTDEVVYLSAMDEGKYVVAQANAPLDENQRFLEPMVGCRYKGDFMMSPVAAIDFADVSPMQLVSVAASLIPFLENDDANRALMGSNMQRQAVPLMQASSPLVGTGMELLVARDSGVMVSARRTGTVEYVDGARIVVRATEDQGVSPAIDIYNLLKYQRSNYNTCINQRPLVSVGDTVEMGDVIADGPSTDRGELALGRNVLVAFMPWNGYNFEDSILISSRIVRDDVFTSIHIEEFEIVARDTRLGPEEITRDIPNASEETLRHLDEVGIVRIGAEVKAGDVLVGKVTPKSESPMTPEEKLLRAIFGEKAADVRDSSLHLPPGVQGTVVEVRVFSRRGLEKDERALLIERQAIDRLEKDRHDEMSLTDYYMYHALQELLISQIYVSGPKVSKIAPGETLTMELLSSFSKGLWWQIVVENPDAMQRLESLQAEYKTTVARIQKKFQDKVDKIQAGDDLLQGELKKVKVFVAIKHKLQPGDKMAGRHGNKGVISRIVPEEDMPYLEDGTVVDMVLNPLGVPSRMNVGQILETHLGWASLNLGRQIGQMLDDVRAGKQDSQKLRETIASIVKPKTFDVASVPESLLYHHAEMMRDGVRFSTPVFDGAKEADIKALLRHAGLDQSGQVTLYDGRTGEAFDRKVTVGVIYMLKLHHLVDEKIHARSIGPYSLVTQQPLGGKSHFGGQRFGEMECWALQAYGAAYTLQEILTVKSDDVTGRIKMYESIVRGDQTFECGIPESFHVMLKELKSLCLNVTLGQD